MKVNFKVSKATMLKVAAIALGILSAKVDAAERKIEIQEAVEEYMKKNTVVLTERVSGM